MLFDEFISRLGEVDFKALPGDVAQLKMAPRHRKSAVEYLRASREYRTAAVLALVVPGIGRAASLVLIERTGGSHVHAAQYSFPGGKQEAGESLADTALREAQEEIGVSPDQVEIVGALTELYIPPSNFLVYPFLAVCHDRPFYQLSEAEVQRVCEVPIGDLMSADAVQEGFFRSSAGQEVHAPFFSWEDVKIWGATAMMISEIIELSGRQ